MQPSLKDWLARKPAGRKPRSPIPRVSKKRQGANREYLKRRSVFLREHHTCEAGPLIPHHLPCDLSSKDIHHRAGRIGAKLLDEHDWIPTCRICHDWIHSHPSEARKLGLLV